MYKPVTESVNAINEIFKHAYEYHPFIFTDICIKATLHISPSEEEEEHEVTRVIILRS